MKFIFFVLVFILTCNDLFAAAGRCLDNGTNPGRDWQQVLCSHGAAQMVRFPGKEARICEGYPGCMYVPPSNVGKCVDDGTHPGQNWQQICDQGAAQMVRFPGKEVRICQGYPGCVYVP